MSLLQEFINNIEQQNLFQKNDYLLLAVSGGADSVALCELCFQAGFHFEIAHCNFQLRGEESERDEKFALQLGEKYWTKVHLKKFDTTDYAAQNKISIQVAARELRYQWFDELLKDADRQPSSDGKQSLTNEDSSMTIHHSPFTIHESPLTIHHSRFLLTAHHANDNIETLLMNFFKGTGIKGLQGILPKQKKIVRPLLFAKREAILSFIKENNLDFVEDSSNNSDKYTRNYFRHQLIPSIQKVFPQVEENLLNNIERFGEMEILYNQSVSLHKKKLLEQKGNEIHIPVLKLLKTKPLKTMIYEIIRDYGFTAHQIDDAVSLLNAESGKFISSPTHKILKNRNWLIIAPVSSIEAQHILIEETEKEISFEQGKLKLKKHAATNEKLPAEKNIATLDLKNISFPLLLRKWKRGDYFYPLGMQGKKKLGKFFIDQKLSLTEKEKIWVIESDKKILWIIGQRIDDRFKVTEKTKQVLQISFHNAKQ
ncbi:MAG: tRNA lysidine(34) synthetase TilS [Ginsengibacter sp.]